jgi:hypothetical protein
VSVRINPFAALGPLSLLLALGCDSTPPPTPAFVFTRPELVAMACFDLAWEETRRFDKAGKALFDDEFPIELPLACCASATPLNTMSPFADELTEDACYAGRKDKSGRSVPGRPALHALVTQSTRGEVATVDLAQRAIVDGDKLIPGPTFVDVGGLPRAIVTPPHKPGSPDVGPPFTYVASGEQQLLLAVKTCAFRVIEKDCDPMRDTKPLPGPPVDMVLADDALWLSLEASEDGEAPSPPLLARVALGGDGPFAGEPTFFALPDAGAVVPDEPVAEDEEYLASCGLGYEAQVDAAERALPLAPLATASGPATPGRLRWDEDTKLLFVADKVQPVIRAFRVAGGNLTLVGVLPTGAPIRDFVLTPAVPKVVGGIFAPPADKPSFGPDEVRYLYAIDDRDGSVLVQRLELEGGLVRGTPLRLPAARRYADRLGSDESMTALEIVDNRRLFGPSDEFSGVCDAFEREGLSREDALEAERRNATGKELDSINAELAVITRVGPGQMRGVFLVATTVRGSLDFFDIHDLDLFCRADLACGDAEKPTELADRSGVTPLAVRRHSARIAAARRSGIDLSNRQAFDEVDCPAGYYPATQRDVDASNTKETIACALADPWANVEPGWSLAWEGNLLSGVRGRFDVEGDKAVFYGPAGFDLCERGVLAADNDAEGDDYDGDVMVVTGEPPSYAPEACATPKEGQEAHLRVLEAYRDHLVLEAPTRSAEAPSLEGLATCYPDLVDVDVRVNERYFVFSPRAPSRVVADAEGRCVADAEKDERSRLRAAPGETFDNGYVRFTLAESAPRSRSESIRLTPAQGRDARAEVARSVAGSSALDSLPVSVRYVAETGQVFVVDAAQGLRSFTLTPLSADPATYR